MKTEKFKVIQFIRELLILIDNQMDNFPKKDIELKNRIRMNSYDLLEIAYEANSTQNVEYKKELLNKVIAKIKVVDFLLNLAFDKQIINQKRYYKFGSKMDDITKYIIRLDKFIKITWGMVGCVEHIVLLWFRCLVASPSAFPSSCAVMAA